MAETEAQKRATRKWRKANARNVCVTMYPCDRDILEYLEATGNITRTVKNALREYKANHPIAG